MQSAELFKFDDDDVIVKKYLDNMLPPVLSNIIISYYASSWYWKKMYKKNAHNDFFRIINSKLVIIKECAISKNIEFDKYGNINVPKYLHIRFVLNDGPHLYLCSYSKIHVVHYDTKQISELKMYSLGNFLGFCDVTDHIVSNIICIKNKTVYTRYFNKLPFSSIMIKEDKEEYEHKNINIHTITDTYEIVDSVSVDNNSALLCDIVYAFVDNSNEMIISILDKNVKHDIICASTLTFGMKAWCIFSKHYTMALYGDEYQIICSQYRFNEVTKLICFNKFSRKYCEHEFDNKYLVQCNNNTFALKKSSDIYVYKTM